MSQDLIPAAALSRQITDFVFERTEAIITRFLSDFVIPGFFYGHRKHGSSGGADLLSTLAHLHTLGVSKIAGVPLDRAMAKVLRDIDGPTTDTFYSYFVAESLLAFGPFENNPLLADFTDAERENVKAAVDSTQIYNPETQQLRGQPNNYWAVLARCEFARQRLGLLQDDSILQQTVAQTRELLFHNPLGYFDDDREGHGRYDTYSADTHLFCEPFWHLFDANRLDSNLRQHVRLVEKIAMGNGASFVFGRSTGPLSICMTMELAALALERGLAADATRSLGLVAHAFEAFKGWFEDDLINAHRHGNTEAYRGVYRILQMSLNCLCKLGYVAEKLRHLTAIACAAEGSLFPSLDEFIPFDDRNAGVWMFRNEHLAFQLALTDGGSSDYAPWLRSPGLLENPVDSQLFCGVPRLTKGAREFTVGGLPVRVKKSDGAIAITYKNFRCVSGGQGTEPFPGQRTVTYRVEGDTIFGEEHLVFEQPPDALSFYVPETDRPLRVTVKSETLFHQDTIGVSGMGEWRSCWSALKNLHQVHLAPAREVRFSFEITPKLRLRMIPGREHDYMTALLTSLPADYVVETPWPQGAAVKAEAMIAGIDILHVGWPEYLFGAPGKYVEKFDRDYFQFIEELGRSGVRIVWTMHNRRPHHMESERGRELYRRWARIADGVIHHSQWGMKLMRAELPYRSDARHVVIPHGHFGAQMAATRPRAEIEAALGLSPCAMRFGVLGRWQKEKQVEMIFSAFLKAARPDQQLVVTAHTHDITKPDDPRIIFLPRKDWMLREDIAADTRLCDALISAHTGDTYLTSGVSADAVGVGIPMIAPHWEFFHETLGDAAIYHDNTVESLTAVFASITPADLERGKSATLAQQPKFAWPLLAEKTLEFYRSLGRKQK